MANENNWVTILIKKLGLSTTADFCRKTDLGRGLVDKLSAGDNNPRFDTLVKIKEAFPQVNMNWLVTGMVGEILDEVLDDEEAVMLDYYRKNIKAKKDEFLLMDFWSVMEWSAQEYQELKELDLSIKAHSIKHEGYREFSSLVILQQRQRRAISELLRNTNIAGFVDTEDKQKKLKKKLSRITGEIQKTINILDGE